MNFTENSGNQLIQLRIDHRVLSGFMILMLIANVSVFFVLWKGIREGRNDFPIFYSNAQMVREGQASHLYDFDAENKFIRRVTDVPRVPNNHVPYELLIFWPFTFLRFFPAYELWTGLGFGMLAGVVLLTRNCRSKGRSRLPFAFLTVLAFFPAWYCLLMGHDSILLLFLFTLSFWLWKRGNDDLAGFILALGLFRPQLVLPFVLVAFLGGKWRFVRGFIPGALLVIALSMWVVGLHGMADYARLLVSQGTETSAKALDAQWTVRPGQMATWRGFLSVCLPDSVPPSLRGFLLLFGTFAALIWAGKKMRSVKTSLEFDLGFAVAVATVLLVSFHSFLHDFSLMILPILIAGPIVASSARVSTSKAYLVVTLGFLFFLTPLYLALLWTSNLGLFFLPAIGSVWFFSRWGSGKQLEADLDQRVQEPISFRAV